MRRADALVRCREVGSIAIVGAARSHAALTVRAGPVCILVQLAIHPASAIAFSDWRDQPENRACVLADHLQSRRNVRVVDLAKESRIGAVKYLMAGVASV